MLVENEEIAIMIKNTILHTQPLFYARLFYVFCFSAPCLFTPPLNLCYLIFILTPFGCLHCVMIIPCFWWECCYWFMPFWLTSTYSGKHKVWVYCNKKLSRHLSTILQELVTLILCLWTMCNGLQACILPLSHLINVVS